MEGVSFNSVTHSFIQNVSPAVSRVTNLALDVFFEYGIFLAGGLYAGYQFYKGYQCSQLNPSYLDDKLKLVHVEMLLKKANSAQDSKPILEECEKLLASIKSTDYEKTSLIEKLAFRFADSDPERSYFLATQLNYACPVLRIATELHKKQFTPAKVIELYRKALTAHNLDCKKSSKKAISDLEIYLNLAKGFHELNESNLRDKALKRAPGVVPNLTSPLNKLTGFIEIAKCYHEIKNEEKRLEFFKKAKDFLKKYISSNDLPLAHLILARAYIDMEIKDDYHLNAVLQMFKMIENDPFKKEEFSILKTLVSKILSNEKELLPEFEEFKGILINRLDKTIYNCKSIDPLNLMSAADACKALKDDKKTKKIIKYLHDEMEKFDNKKKHYLLSALIDYYTYDKFPDEFKVNIERLKVLYAGISFDDKYPSPSKHLIAEVIIEFYNEAGLTKEADECFEKYISDLILKEEKPFGAINNLVHLIHKGAGFSEAQVKKALEKAEKILLKVPSLSIPQVKSMIAHAYAQVDMEKADQLIKAYQSSEGREHYILGTIMAVALAALYIAPGPAYLAIVAAGSMFQVYNLGRGSLG